MPSLRSLRRPALALLAPLAWAACRPSPPPAEAKAPEQATNAAAAPAPTPEARAADASPVGVAPGAVGWCAAGEEAPSLRCAMGLAWRRGDTLFVQADGGAPQARVTSRPSDDRTTHVQWEYVGALKDSAGVLHHVLRVIRFEAGGVFLVNGRSGREVELLDTPLPSPDGRHFAVGTRAFDMCALPTRIQLWRLTADKPVLEAELAPYRCEEERGWAPADLSWQGPDALHFVALEVLGAEDEEAAGDSVVDGLPVRPHAARLVRTAEGWTFVGTPEPEDDSDEET